MPTRVKLETSTNGVVTVDANIPGAGHGVNVIMWLSPDSEESDGRIFTEVSLYKKAEDQLTLDTEIGEMEALVAALTQCLAEARRRGYLPPSKVVTERL